jgi:hypothetical protein
MVAYPGSNRDCLLRFVFVRGHWEGRVIQTLLPRLATTIIILWAALAGFGAAYDNFPQISGLW